MMKFKILFSKIGVHCFSFDAFKSLFPSVTIVGREHT